MRSGPIKTEDAEHRVDRRGEVLPLWERGRAAAVELPWVPAANLDPAEVRTLVASARSVSLAVGATSVSRAVLDAVVKGVGQGCRVYVYADRVLETDAALVRGLAAVGDRVLVRTGHRPPADWFVVDHGREGRLIVGASATARRWIIPVDGPLARSLFEAFRVLFWFHAVREALPDAAGTVAFRTPLAAPFTDPGSDVPLASGRLRLGVNLDDPVPDAEIRFSPVPSDPGPARILFVPPGAGAGAGNGGTGTALASALAQRGRRVVWTNLELPRTTVTRQRLVLDLVESPIALQLEWPRAVAIDLFHRFERVAQQPEWEFHPARRLGDVRGPVLLDGAAQAAPVVPSITLKAGDVPAAILEFDSARPSRLPDIPPLALEATVQWRRVPATVPPGARQAEIVRRWTAVDEWASRQVDSLRVVLDELDQQEGLLGKLLRWLPSREPLVLERRKLREEVDEIGESRPSQAPEQAEKLLGRLAQVGSRLMTLRRSHHDDRQAGADADAEDAQRGAWKARVHAAETSLKEKRAKLAANEDAQQQAREDEQAALAVVDDAVASRRAARKAALEEEKSSLAAELEEARSALQRLDDAHKGRPPKAERKEAHRRMQQAEQALARNRRDLEGIAGWVPPASELGDASALLNEARTALQDLRAAAGKLASEIKELDRQTAETFQFVPPPRLPAPATTDLAAPPPVPDEAPPELGELFEHQGKRFLAIRTWEQLKPAERVAQRLRAEIVALAASK